MCVSEGSTSKTEIKKCLSVKCRINLVSYHLEGSSNLLCRYRSGSGCEDLPWVCYWAGNGHICDLSLQLGSFGLDFGQQREKGAYKKLQV